MTWDHSRGVGGLRDVNFGIADEQVEVVNQRGDVVIAFIHIYQVSRRAGSQK